MKSTISCLRCGGTKKQKGRAYRSQHGLPDIPKDDRFSRFEKRRDAYVSEDVRSPLLPEAP